MEVTRVRDVMTPDVTKLQRNEELTLADHVMNLGRIRHLPVLDDDGEEIVRIVSQRDPLSWSVGSGTWAWAARLNGGIHGTNKFAKSN